MNNIKSFLSDLYSEFSEREALFSKLMESTRTFIATIIMSSIVFILDPENWFGITISYIILSAGFIYILLHIIKLFIVQKDVKKSGKSLVTSIRFAVFTILSLAILCGAIITAMFTVKINLEKSYSLHSQGHSK